MQTTGTARGAIAAGAAGVPPAAVVNLSPDVWTEPFWQAAADHRLTAPRCGDCGTFRMPPSPFCHACRSQAVEWVEPSGRGVVYSFTVIRRGLIPALEECVPYVVAVVELPDAGHVRLVTNLVDVDVADVRIGMEVTLVWDDIEPGIAIPRFRPS